MRLSIFEVYEVDFSASFHLMVMYARRTSVIESRLKVVLKSRRAFLSTSPLRDCEHQSISCSEGPEAAEVQRGDVVLGWTVPPPRFSISGQLLKFKVFSALSSEVWQLDGPAATLAIFIVRAAGHICSRHRFWQSYGRVQLLKIVCNLFTDLLMRRCLSTQWMTR